MPGRDWRTPLNLFHPDPYQHEPYDNRPLSVAFSGRMLALFKLSMKLFIRLNDEFANYHNNEALQHPDDKFMDPQEVVHPCVDKFAQFNQDHWDIKTFDDWTVNEFAAALQAWRCLVHNRRAVGPAHRRCQITAMTILQEFLNWTYKIPGSEPVKGRRFEALGLYMDHVNSVDDAHFVGWDGWPVEHHGRKKET